MNDTHAAADRAGLKALSIKQPWAWSIIEGFKPIENRDWKTNFRGTVAVHASKGMTREEYDDFYFFIRDTEGLWPVVDAFPSKDNLVRGAILGTVDIVGCVSDSTSPWFFGEYGFLLANPRKLRTPIECRGALGFWDVPFEIAAKIREEH